MLTEAEEAYRRDKFTGSLAPPVMTLTDPVKLNRLADIKAGLEPPDPENYQMRLGSLVEPFLKRELELQCGHPITRCGEIVDHPTIPNICVKLDGYRAYDDAVVEFKFLGNHRRREEYFPYYYWQVLLQMLCTGASKGILAVAQGTNRPVENEVIYDQGCADALLERAAAFMLCVRTNTPPCPLPPIIPPDRWRTLDVVAEPTNWSPQLLQYLESYSITADAAADHDAAGTAARALIPDDVGKVFAGLWLLTRDKRGVVSIRRRAV
jgi:hypothetical protein